MSDTAIAVLGCVGLALSASYIQGLIGFGLGMIFVAGFAVGPGLSPATAAVVANALILVQGALHVGYDRRSLAWPAIGWTAIGLLPGTLGGFALLAGLSSGRVQWLAHLLGLFVLASTLWALYGRSTSHDRRSARACCLWGFIAGLCGGLFGVPGPPIVILFQGLALSPAARRASMLALFVILAGLRTLLAWFHGSLDSAAWTLILAGGPAVLLGGWLALVYPLSISPRALRRTVLGLLFGLGLKLALFG